jgi:hypothetical protein
MNLRLRGRDLAQGEGNHLQKTIMRMMMMRDMMMGILMKTKMTQQKIQLKRLRRRWPSKMKRPRSTMKLIRRQNLANTTSKLI